MTTKRTALAPVTLPARAFSTRAEWRAWLATNHAKALGLWVVFDKKGTGRRTLDYESAVLEALCFGWIDSLVRRIDDDRYAQKFTPRSDRAKWSATNLSRFRELEAGGLMTAAGRAVFAPAVPRRTAPPPPKDALVPEELRRALAARGHRTAAAFFARLAPSHRRRYTLWVADGKRPETRERRAREAVRLLADGVKALLK